jgi:hypothetical protein
MFGDAVVLVGQGDLDARIRYDLCAAGQKGRRQRRSKIDGHSTRGCEQSIYRSFYSLFFALIIAAGAAAGINRIYYLLLIPAAVQLGWQLKTLDIDDSKDWCPSAGRPVRAPPRLATSNCP